MCGLGSDGALLCWGDPGFVGIGFGNTDPVWSPTRLGIDTWSAVAGSGFSSSGAIGVCAIRGGKPYYWGDNSFGEIGIGSTVSPQLSPVAVNVPAPTQWTEIATSDHTCAIGTDTTLWCWGANDAGQLGTGTTSTTPTTAPSAPLSGTWLHVAVMSYGFRLAMTCGIRTDHTLWCWGKDQPPSATQHLAPTQVGSDATWASLSMASSTTCAVKLNRTLWCWGSRSVTERRARRRRRCRLAPRATGSGSRSVARSARSRPAARCGAGGCRHPRRRPAGVLRRRRRHDVGDEPHADRQRCRLEHGGHDGSGGNISSPPRPMVRCGAGAPAQPSSRGSKPRPCRSPEVTPAARTRQNDGALHRG